MIKRNFVNLPAWVKSKIVKNRLASSSQKEILFDKRSTGGMMSDAEFEAYSAIQERNQAEAALTKSRISLVDTFTEVSLNFLPNSTESLGSIAHEELLKKKSNRIPNTKIKGRTP